MFPTMGTSTSCRMSGETPDFSRKDQQEINSVKVATHGWTSVGGFPGVSSPLSALPQPVTQLLVLLKMVLFAAARQTG